jgi:hypothetical protein
MPLAPKGSYCIRPGLYSFDRGVFVIREGRGRESMWGVIARADWGTRDHHGIERFRSAVFRARKLVQELESEGLSGSWLPPSHRPAGRWATKG